MCMHMCPKWQSKKRLSLLGALIPLNTFASSLIYPAKIAASRMHCGLRLALFISKFSLLPPAYKSETYLHFLIVCLLYVYSQVYIDDAMTDLHICTKMVYYRFPRATLLLPAPTWAFMYLNYNFYCSLLLYTLNSIANVTPFLIWRQFYPFPGVDEGRHLGLVFAGCYSGPLLCALENREKAALNYCELNLCVVCSSSLCWYCRATTASSSCGCDSPHTPPRPIMGKKGLLGHT